MPTDPIQASLKHPKLATLYTLWNTCRQGGVAPTMRTIDGAHLDRWRADLTVIEVRTLGEFRYAFYGSGLRQAFGVDMTGVDVAALPPDRGAILKAEYRQVVQSKAPAWRLYTAQFDGAWQTWERLVLPVLDPTGSRVAWLLVAAHRVDAGVSLAV